MGIGCADLQIFERVRVKIMDLGLSSVRVWVKVRVSVRFMVSFCYFKVHKIRRSARPHFTSGTFSAVFVFRSVLLWCLLDGVQIPHGTGQF